MSVLGFSKEHEVGDVGEWMTPAPAVSISSFNAWIERLFQAPAASEEKIVLCGPRYAGMVTGCYNPKYWPKLRGSARQRRIKRRHLARMWEVTKGTQFIQDPPSLILGTW